jgi:hypothetical protein
MRRAVAAGVGTALALVAVAALVSQPAIGSHARPKATAPLKVSLVPAYSPCAAANRQHGPPLAFPSCSPPQQASTRLTAGNPPAQAAQLEGYWSIFVRPGLAGPPDDTAARMFSTITDVRCGAPSAGCPTAGADYAGELEVRITVRMSDHYNAVALGGGTDPATVQDVDLSFSMPCFTTSDPAIGATCSHYPGADILSFYPGAVKDSKRVVMEFGPVKVLDGGDDGDADTDDGAQQFLTQGVFIP